MSCRDCTAVQDRADRGMPHFEIYIRIGSGNVLVLGCIDHVRQLLEQLHRGEPDTEQPA
jgi:hypothetical protein